ncbi:hypothetical protein BJF86_06515 [Serinicoccus sp. CNJ-927]|uniref:DUF58 domain-containing protein n=1 Tax=Serinicoccus sp. CNJ-927 TaxID=1904970 RepID=UPI000967E93C|nr:DUF58 domain-containing protein [Serinicoccus sp. CNJ-927]OLT39890.1 hypothetical protein BJF86_06515 [Serinicoccus sp. CNJ-927]
MTTSGSPWGLLTARGKVFAVLGVLLVVAGTFLGYEDVTRVGLALLLLPVLVLLLMPRRPPRLTVSREVTPQRLTPEERGKVEVRFRNVGARSAVYLAEEHLDYQLGDRPRYILPRMSTGEERRLRYTVRSRHRGAYALGPIVLRQRDPFGLTFRTLHLSSRTELLVLPRVVSLGDDRLRGSSRGSEGEMPQMIALQGEDDVSIRSYRDGDELRRVHWPATAHRGELMVRQEDRPARRRAVLLLDSRADAHPGTGMRASYEWAVSAIASVARHLVADGFVVHLLADETLRDGSAEHQVELGPLMDTLARVQPEEDARLDRVTAAASSFTSGGVLLIAAVVAHDDAALRSLASVRQPGSRALAFVLDPARFGADQGGSSATDRPTGVLADAGWRTVTVGSHTELAQAWVSLRQAALGRSA